MPNYSINALGLPTYFKYNWDIPPQIYISSLLETCAQIYLNREQFLQHPLKINKVSYCDCRVAGSDILMYSSLEKITTRNNNHRQNFATPIALKRKQIFPTHTRKNTVHSCQPFQPLLCSKKLRVMKTGQSQSNGCVY